MSFLQRIVAWSLRPGAFHSPTFTGIGILRPNPQTPTAKSMPTNFYTSSMYHRPMGRRSYSSDPFSYESHFKRNMRVIYGAIGLNTAIFLYGNYTRVQAEQGSPESWYWFNENFTLNYVQFTHEGRWWTAITSVFSHLDFKHLFGNMVSTYFFGLVIAGTPCITPLMIAKLILGSGLCGSIFTLGLRHWEIKNQTGKSQWGRTGPPELKRGLGFSGAVMGISAVAAALDPKRIFYLAGIIPAPLWLLVTGYAAYDIYSFNDKTSNVGHSAHIGGLVFGAAYYLVKLRGF
ncbi:hypothetical protein DM02DRAFT_609427 [Periconia macrospinosa]|uniref:Peptidase S54 rhomboid domain-containing protein n=1 Tax=Periconia macrospinosa TaxID=97972 RepID=A0A2V1E952_9PLEO|nr:hypothetical protein DM02DRAFT_609427 [Periconia macrospinosa]